jgi:hypothetical protein
LGRALSDRRQALLGSHQGFCLSRRHAAVSQSPRTKEITSQIDAERAAERHDRRHPSKRDQSNRAWLLLMLAKPANPAQPLKLTSLSGVAAYETKVRAERILAGQAAARERVSAGAARSRAGESGLRSDKSRSSGA